MTTVFLDTVGLLALWDVSDQWHQSAEAAFLTITQQQTMLVTTAYVLLECGNAAARRTFRKDVCDLRDALELRDELIAPTNEEWLQAWAAYQGGEAGDAGIVDHVSFLVMKRIAIAEAFTNDNHFEAAGFKLLF